MFTTTAKPLLILFLSIALSCGRSVTNLVSDDINAGAMDSGDSQLSPPDDGSSDGPTDAVSSIDTPEDDGSSVDPTDAVSTSEPPEVQPILCNNKPCACNNGIDDDNDNLIDGFDPECTGPFDDDESSFATGKSEAKNNLCQDCFFDANSGHGDDGCYYHSDCLLGKIPSMTTPSDCSSDCEVTAQCIETCLPRTPNGCDCFGCCEVTKEDNSRITVRIVETCSLAVIDDPIACPRCVQSQICRNDCGLCELCLGKPSEALPERCKDESTETGIDYSCDQGERVCSATLPCKDNEYCYQGCCLPVLL